MTTDIDRARSFDPACGSFCALSKAGKPMNMPPASREPASHCERNPRGVRRPFKTTQDHLPVQGRERVRAALKRVEAAA